VIYFLVFMVPIVFAGPFEHRTLQLGLFSALGFVALAVWCLSSGQRFEAQSLKQSLVTGPNLAILAFLISALASLVFSVNPYYSQLALVQLLAGVGVYGLVAYRCRHSKQMRGIVVCLTLLVVVVVFAALVVNRDLRSLQLAGTFHDRPLLGAFLCLFLPLMVGLGTGIKHRGQRIGAQISVVFVGLALLLTGCRSSWFGAIAGLAAFVGLGTAFAWKVRSLPANKHLLIGTPLLILVAVGVILGNSGLMRQVQARAATLTSVQADASVVDRMNLWKTAGKVIAERPGIGWGIGTYAFAQAQLNPQSRPLSAILRTGPSLSESPHNTYLQIAGEQGLTGLAAYLAILGMFFWTGITALGRTSPGLRQFTLIGCLAAIVAHGVDAFSNPAWTFPEVSLFFWLILGIGMRAAGIAQDDHSRDSRSDDGGLQDPAAVKLQRAVRLAVVGGCLVAFAAHIVGLNLLASAAASNPGRIAGAGPPGVPDYPGPPPRGGRGDNDGGPGTAVVAGAVAAGVGGLSQIAPTPACSEPSPPLPQADTNLLAVRILADKDWFGAGTRRCVHLEVLSARDNQWYSVTDRPETQFAVRVGEEWLKPNPKVPNQFELSKDAPKDLDGKHLVLRGSFTLPGQEPWVAEKVFDVKLSGLSGGKAGVPPTGNGS
jgi:O-antigen ligase